MIIFLVSIRLRWVRMGTGVILLLVMSSCRKDSLVSENITVVGLDAAHNEATVNVKYEFSKSSLIDGGLVWNAVSSPTIMHFEDLDSINFGDEHVFVLDTLHGNTLYQVVGFLVSNQSGQADTLFSIPHFFKTPQTPAAPCSISPNSVEYGGFSTSMSSLIGVDEDTCYTLTSSDNGGGYVKFSFNKHPLSGIYTDGNNCSTDFKILREINLGGCQIEPTGGFKINVINDGVGGLDISFCTIGVVAWGGSCTTQAYLFSGHLRK